MAIISITLPILQSDFINTQYRPEDKVCCYRVSELVDGASCLRVTGDHSLGNSRK